MRLKECLLTILAISLPGLTQEIPNPTSELVNRAETRFLTNEGAGISYVVSGYNWSRTDGEGAVGDLTSPGSGKALTLTPCPPGVDVSNNPNAQYGVFIFGAGSSEAVPVTGGTCRSGGATGTIIVTTKYIHAPGFRVGSASGGNQEAINVASASMPAHPAPQVVIQEVPAGSNTANYNIHWPVFFKASRATLNGEGAEWQCFTRSACLINTDYAALGQGHNVIRGITFQPAVNQDGTPIASVSAASGVYTVNTVSPHGLNPGDWVIFYYSTPAQTQEAKVQLITADGTQFTYQIGARTTFPSSNGFGWVALEDTAIEVISDGTKLQDIRFEAGAVAGARFHQGVVVGNDQDFVIDGMTVLSRAIRSDSNFVGNVVYIRGDQRQAAVPYIHHLEASMQCSGNGIRNTSGNTMHVMDSVIQGTSQYSIYYGNGLNSWEIDNVYYETGACSNPFYTAGSFSAEAGFISNTAQSLTVQGSAPVGGAFPVFASGGSSASQRNYYVIAHDTKKGISPMLFIGTAQPATSGTSISLYWPNLDLSGSGMRTWDIVVTLTNSPATAPYTGNAFSVATGIAARCTTTGICTYTDTQGAATAYSVPKITWNPSYWFWPGSFVLGRSGTLYVDQAAQAGQYIPSTYLPQVFAKRCPDVGNTYWYSPIWLVCYAGDSVGNNNPKIGAQVVQIGGASGSWTSGITGATNYNPGPDAVVPRQIITTMDGRPDLTFATPGYVRTGSPKDSFIGTDTVGDVGMQDQTYGAPGGHNFYVKDQGTSGKSWAFHIGTSGPQLKKSKYSELNAANPCSPGSEGSLAAVTDAASAVWGEKIAGGGLNHVLAYCDGTHWTVR